MQSPSAADHSRSCPVTTTSRSALTYDKPASASFRATAAEQDRLQQTLWRLGGEAINARPRDSAPRLYIDSLNAMIDQQGVRLAGLNNHPPNAVLLLELFGAALALGMLALYISVLGRGLLPVVLAAVVVTFLVLVTFDLDRPTRGLITDPRVAPAGREGDDESPAGGTCTSVTRRISTRSSMAQPPHTRNPAGGRVP